LTVPTVTPIVSPPLARPLVWPVLRQHLEDAAFCWLRRDTSLWLPTMRQEHLCRIDRLLEAHLFGLKLAAAAVLPQAQEQLQRWKTVDEVFVSTYLALQADLDESTIAAVEHLLEDDPQCVRGAAAALLWTAHDAALPLLHRWWKSGNPVLRRAALPAALQHPRINREAAVLDSLESGDAALAARALRAIGEWRLEPHRERLKAAIRLADPLCRLESAYALRLFGFDVHSDTTVAELIALDTHGRRRMLLSIAATAKPARLRTTFDALLQAGEDRDALWLQIFRGDAAAVDCLTAALDGPLALLAAYGLQHVTGVDIDAERLWLNPDPMAPLPTPSTQADTSDDDHAHDDDADADADADAEARIHPEDAGLLPPDVAALRAWPAIQAAAHSGELLLAGQPALTQIDKRDTTELTLPQHWQLAFLRCQLGKAGALARIGMPALI